MILSRENGEHERAIFKCRMAETAERFDEMVGFISEACAKTKEPLGPNERNLLSVAYKNSVGSRRHALRALAGMKQRYKQRGDDENVKLIDEYYNKILEELRQICFDIINLIEKTILSPEVVQNLKNDLSAKEFKVFFHKMHADYYRYLAEFAQGKDKEEAIQKASSNYQLAMDEAVEGGGPNGLPTSHPIRLGLCLNYSVFLYEIQGKPEEAKKLAKQAFDDALDNLDSSGETEYKDNTLILQLLRDNATLWSNGADAQINNTTDCPVIN